MNRDTPTRPAAPVEQAPVEVAYFRPARVPSFPAEHAPEPQGEHWLDRVAREQRAALGPALVSLIQAAADSDPGEAGEVEGRS